MKFTTFCFLFFWGSTLLHAGSAHEHARFWELRVSDDFNDGEPQLAARRFIDELRMSENRERKVQLLQTFQHILAARSEHYPSASLPDDDTRSELLSLKTYFNVSLTVELETSLEQLNSQIADLYEGIGIKQNTLPIDDTVNGNYPGALFALEVLYLFRRDLKPAGLGEWKMEFERAVSQNDYFGAYAAGVAAIKSIDDREQQLAILEELKQRFVNQKPDMKPALTKTERYQFYAWSMVENNLKQINFEWNEGGNLNNVESIRLRVIHGVAPRTDVPNISDVRQYPSVVLTLRLIEAISGEVDPILDTAHRDGLL